MRDYIVDFDQNTFGIDYYDLKSVMWIWMQFGPRIQRYKIKGKPKFNQQKPQFLSQEIIFFSAIFSDESSSLKVCGKRVCIDLNKTPLQFVERRPITIDQNFFNPHAHMLWRREDTHKPEHEWLPEY